MKNRSLLFIFSMAILLSSCKDKDHTALKNGIWRGALKTVTAVEIPFNFTVSDSLGKKSVSIINGKEHLKVEEITIENDSIRLKMPLFDSEIIASSKGNTLTGRWVLHLANKDIEMPFSAEYGEDWKFFKVRPSSDFNVSGRWSTTFVSQDNADTTLAVAEFKQADGMVNGTFLTSTGDYGFLSGTVSDDKLYLSSFDGSSAYLFTGKLLNDSTLVDGKFYSGVSFSENWAAVKDDKAMLLDPYSLTSLKPEYTKLDFSFPNLNNQNVSLSDSKFKNKVVVVQLFGSWCPNCIDETAYLAPFYKKYKNKGVEVVGLAYERTPNFEKSKQNVERLKAHFDVSYDLLLTGYINKGTEVLKSLPMLNNFMAFPTTIIIDKKGLVRKIHTGFNGPGTGEHYTEFIMQFEQTINKLLAEN